MLDRSPVLVEGWEGLLDVLFATIGIYFLRTFGNILARLQIQILPVLGTILYVNVQKNFHTFQDKRNFSVAWPLKSISVTLKLHESFVYKQRKGRAAIYFRKSLCNYKQISYLRNLLIGLNAKINYKGASSTLSLSTKEKLQHVHHRKENWVIGATVFPKLK